MEVYSKELPPLTCPAKRASLWTPAMTEGTEGQITRALIRKDRPMVFNASVLTLPSGSKETGSREGEKVEE